MRFPQQEMNYGVFTHEDKENLNEQMLLLTISNPRKAEEIKKYNIRPVLVKGQAYSFRVRHTQKHRFFIKI